MKLGDEEEQVIDETNDLEIVVGIMMMTLLIGALVGGAAYGIVVDFIL